jgi:hypothetical protein
MKYHGNRINQLFIVIFLLIKNNKYLHTKIIMNIINLSYVTTLEKY